MTGIQLAIFGGPFEFQIKKVGTSPLDLKGCFGGAFKAKGPFDLSWDFASLEKSRNVSQNYFSSAIRRMLSVLV